MQLPMRLLQNVCVTRVSLLLLLIIRIGRHGWMAGKCVANGVRGGVVVGRLMIGAGCGPKRFRGGCCGCVVGGGRKGGGGERRDTFAADNCPAVGARSWLGGGGMDISVLVAVKLSDDGCVLRKHGQMVMLRRGLICASTYVIQETP